MRRAIAALTAAFWITVLGAQPAAAWTAPRAIATVGGTLGVLGEFDEGGFMVELGLLWPLEAPFSMGLDLAASDLGTHMGELYDPNTGEPLGPVALGHRAAYEIAWRVDAALPGGWGFAPYASGTWGYARVADDVRGEGGPALSSTGFTLGLGAVRPVGRTQSLGASLRYHRLFNDSAGRFVSAGIDWAFGGAPAR